MFQFNPIGILGLVTVVLCWVLALVLYRAGISGSVARKLALLLVAEGVTLVSSGFIGLILTPAVTATSRFVEWPIPDWYRR